MTPRPPFIRSGIFPLESLPVELRILIASYLTPRGIYALLLAFPAFSEILYVFNNRYTRQQLVYEDSVYRCHTPLQYFCSRGVERVVRRLLETGADPNEISYGDYKCQIAPLIHAIGFRSAPIVALLLDHGARVNPAHSDSEYIPLHVAVGPPHAVPPRRLHDRDGHMARAAELPQIVQLLIARGARLETRDRRTLTALQTACATVNGNPVFVSALIAAGASSSCSGRLPYLVMRSRTLFPAPPADTRITLLHHAANAGNMSIVQMMLDRGFDVELETRDGMRALDLAVLHKRRELVEFLIRAGANVNSKVKDKTKQPTVLDPFAMVEQEATWEQLEEWLRLRGWRPQGKSLVRWWNLGTDMAMPPTRPVPNENFYY